ncbi:Guanine nucleotide exchange factor MSS4 [Smittium culicis]|uniref:Guanine nucleotide exchange factor MSS4 n=1 Tax=Smittium culicis TaxID=133412 RepID=A0A1R1YKQ3_9FUNG|nr:Guanine nucleotide exchange factor MSS4 [Smittium culicis]
MSKNSSFDTKEMIENLKKTNKKNNRLILAPYVVLCPRESCNSKLLYLQGSYLVYKSPRKNRLLNVVYPEFDPNNTEHKKTKNIFEKPKIPLDVLSAIDAKKNVFLGAMPCDSKTQIDNPDKEITDNSGSGNDSHLDTEGFYWCVSDVFKFENIGMSKPVDGNLRYLICADCDCGPLGYHDPNSVEVQYLKQDKNENSSSKGNLISSITTPKQLASRNISDNSSQSNSQQLVKGSTPVLEYLLAVDKVQYQKL